MSKTRLHKPEPLCQGATIGVVAPASAPPQDRLKVGLDILHRRGFDVRTHQQVFTQEGYLAGNDPIRREALATVLDNPEVSAVWAARGGYGTLRTLTGMTLPVRKPPPVVMGFSDITVLHVWLVDRCNWVTFHGPNITTISSLDQFSRDALNQFLDGYPMTSFGELEPVQGGRCVGPVLAMNLAMLCSLAGTDFFPELSGRILIVEDVGEVPYRLDRLWTQLFRIPSMHKLAGLVIGDLDRGGQDSQVRNTIQEGGRVLEIPVLERFPIGHGVRNVPLPMGLPARLDADSGTLDFLESPFRS